jgi:hypothetical protein
VTEALGSAFAFLSVGGGLAAALITALLVGRGAFLSTLIYLVSVGFELALAEKMRRDIGEDKAP